MTGASSTLSVSRANDKCAAAPLGTLSFKPLLIRGGRGSKIPKILRTSFMYGPPPLPCSIIVDCAWNAWVSWTDCEKTATGTCAVQGGGNRERRREHLITVANGGDPCEAASVVENWPCCPDKDTDAANCASASEECLSGRSALSTEGGGGRQKRTSL